VLGWLVLRGRCYDCAAPISVRYPLVEGLTGALFGLAVALLMAVHQAAATAGYLVLIALAIVLIGVRVDRASLPLGFVAVGALAVVVLLAAPLIVGDLAWPIAAIGAGSAAGFALMAMSRTRNRPATPQASTSTRTP
jgi:leader peptidase (prepilin peptidase)/N-methyltransferase